MTPRKTKRDQLAQEMADAAAACYTHYTGGKLKDIGCWLRGPIYDLLPDKLPAMPKLKIRKTKGP